MDFGLNPYSSTSIYPTRFARDLLELQGLALEDAIHVVRMYQESWPGQKDGQTWCHGETPDGTVLKVLIETVTQEIAKIITVRKVG